MSTVEIEFYVNNQSNDYAVSGDVYLYTVSGTISTEKAPPNTACWPIRRRLAVLRRPAAALPPAARSFR